MVGKFAFWSVVLLVLVVVTGVKSVWNNQNADTHEFGYWQNQYKNAAAAFADSPETKDAALNAPVEVKQVTVLQFPTLLADGTQQQRVDRCQSCHVGLLDPNMTAEKLIKVLDDKTVPTAQVAAYLNDPAHAKTLDTIKTLGAHPGMQTGKGDLGVIHGAKFSYGVTTEASLTPDDTSDYQTQKINLKQHPFPTFGCTTCHYGTGRELIQNSAHGSPEHSQAPLLAAKYMEAACAQCHAQYNIKTFKIAYQQPLTAERIVKILDGADVSADQMPTYLADPKNATTAETVKYVAGAPQMSTIAHGEALFASQACYGCHKIAGFSKGNIGPELTYEGYVAGGTTKIAHQLWDPRYLTESCVMPYFFAARKVNTDLPSTGVVGNPDAGIETVDKRSLTIQAAPVTTEGSSYYDEDVSESLKRHGYVADGSRQKDVDALVTFVASQTGQNYASSQASRFTTIAAYDIARPAEVVPSVAVGKQLFASNGCYACHYIGDPNKAHITGDPKLGKGGIFGPELSWEGTRHSQKWMTEHYKNPQAFVPGSIMPIFPLSDTQREALSMYDGSLRPANANARPVSPDQDLPKDYKSQ